MLEQSRLIERMASAALLAAACLSTGAAHAGASTGTVSLLRAHAGDVVMFAAGENPTKPACSTQGSEWALSLATPTGRAMYAMLLTAAASGRAVSVKGSGACSAWSDREAPYYVTWQP